MFSPRTFEQPSRLPHDTFRDRLMTDAFICDALRTPFGRYGGALSAVRADDLGAIPIRALLARHPELDPAAIDDVLYGCANQAGEDNRNVARMSALLAGLPVDVPGVTLNRLCGSGPNAVGSAAQAIRAGEAGLLLAGGVESMSRAPFVMPKATAAFARENVADDYGISRADQDAMALRSQLRAVEAQKRGLFDAEITPVTVPQKKGDAIVVAKDEHPRETSLEALGKLKPIVRPNGTITAGNASGVNDGACALLLASAGAAKTHGLVPRARVLGMAVAGVAPRLMGIGPAPASKRLLARLGLTIAQMDVIELNEAFAAQGLAVLRQLGVGDDDPRVNPNGGAIALGHPLGASGARLVTTAVNQLHAIGGRYALCTMCIGVGQGIALVVERV